VSKVNRTFYCVQYSSLKHSGWHMLTRDHTVLLAAHTFIHIPSCVYMVEVEQWVKFVCVQIIAFELIDI